MNYDSLKIKRKLNGKNMHLVLVYNLFYQMVCLLKRLIGTFSKREFGSFMTFHLRTDHHVALSADFRLNRKTNVSFFCIALLPMVKMVLHIEKKMKRQLTTKWESRANTDTRNPCTSCGGIWKMFSITSCWNMKIQSLQRLDTSKLIE